MTPAALARAVAAAAPWYDIAWQDWVGVGGSVLGILGLWITYRQAKSAKEAAKNAETAAQAATAAVERTQAQVRANLQLVLLPGLQRVSQELDDAIRRDSHSETRASLDRWRFQAGHVRGLLQHETPEPRLVLRALQASVTLATISTGELLVEDKPVLEACSKARLAVATACDSVTQLVGRNVTQVSIDAAEENG